MAPTKKRTRPTAAAIPIGGTKMPRSNPSAPAAFRMPRGIIHGSRHTRPVHVDGDLRIADRNPLRRLQRFAATARAVTTRYAVNGVNTESSDGLFSLREDDADGMCAHRVRVRRWRCGHRRPGSAPSDCPRQPVLCRTSHLCVSVWIRSRVICPSSVRRPTALRLNVHPPLLILGAPFGVSIRRTRSTPIA